MIFRVDISVEDGIGHGFRATKWIVSFLGS